MPEDEINYIQFCIDKLHTQTSSFRKTLSAASREAETIYNIK